MPIFKTEATTICASVLLSLNPHSNVPCMFFFAKTKSTTQLCFYGYLYVLTLSCCKYFCYSFIMFSPLVHRLDANFWYILFEITTYWFCLIGHLTESKEN